MVLFSVIYNDLIYPELRIYPELLTYPELRIYPELLTCPELLIYPELVIETERGVFYNRHKDLLFMFDFDSTP